jgi:hypothetical protein
MNVDMLKLTRLLNGRKKQNSINLFNLSIFIIEEVQKWRLLKKIHHTELVKSVEKVKEKTKSILNLIKYFLGYLELVRYLS